MAKLLFLAGSQRQDSINKTLARIASEIATEKNAQVTFIDLADYPMPLYDGDAEKIDGMPKSAIELKTLFMDHDGFFIASPEYNGSFSPLIKNVIDWMSRPHEKDEPPLVAYKGKVAALAAASPGGLGGLRGLVPLRMLLSNIGVHVIPTQMAVGGMDSFTNDHKLAHPHHQAMMDSLLNELISTTQSLHA